MVFNSLRAQLSLWLFAPLLITASIDAWVTYRSAHQNAQIVQERLLLGAARMIGEQIVVDNSFVQADVPASALELFHSPIQDRVFYRVSRGNQLLAGYQNLTAPPGKLLPEEVVFFDSEVAGRLVHAVAFAQPVLGLEGPEPVVIEVGQTLDGRNSLAQEIWLNAARRQIVMLITLVVFLWLGLRYATSPLVRLRDSLLVRQPGALEPLAVQHLPSELQPMVNAVNDYVARLEQHINAQGRFLADASHQLRTPLTLLNTQVVYALREKDPVQREEALQATHVSVQHAMRLVHQLLSISRAESAAASKAELVDVDLSEVAKRAIEGHVLLAQSREIDLGFVATSEPAHVRIAPQLAHELVSNILDNALRYSGSDGVVTVRMKTEEMMVVLEVEDNGPGIPETMRNRVFERFYRLDETLSDGCGLGLSIAQEIARSSGGSIQLLTPPTGQGLLVSISFPSVPRQSLASTRQVAR